MVSFIYFDIMKNLELNRYKAIKINTSEAKEFSNMTKSSKQVIQNSLENKPNVLFVLIDDLGTGDIPGYFDTCKVKSMKNLEDLLSKSVVFTDAHATPLCATSRYSFLSGNYVFRGMKLGGTWGLSKRSQFKPGQKSIADMFSNAGYITAMMGKWHLGGKIPPNGGVGPKGDKDMLTNPKHDWTMAFDGGPQDIGFSSSLISIQGVQGPPFAFFRDGILKTPKSDVKHWAKGEYQMPKGTSKIILPGEGDINWDSTAYNMLLVNETIQFLDNHLETRSADPFFAYVATGSVHIPHSPATTYTDGNPLNGTQHTHHMDMVYEVDLIVGTLIKALEDRDLMKDTIIVFTSDNGGLSNKQTNSGNFDHWANGPLKGNKGSLYEGGHRIPLIMRYDGVFPSGKKSNALVGINDFFATFSEIIGVDVPDGQAIDSVSFAKTIYDPDNAIGVREEFAIWNVNLGCAIRSSYHKLIITLLPKETIELYDLNQDPYEENDLSTNSSYFQLKDSLRKKLKEIGSCCVHARKKTNKEYLCLS